MQAGAGLFFLLDALRVFLIDKHIRVPALLSIVEAERVAGIEMLEVFVLRELVDGIAAGVLRPHHVRRPDETIILTREILLPQFRVNGILGKIFELEIVLQCLVFSVLDVRQQVGDCHGQSRRD
jgi:hypothetical protein